jgi:hypothetical protein
MSTTLEADIVESTLEYVSPQSKINLRYSGSGGERNTGIFELKTVCIHNARREPKPLTLKTSGFELVHHECRVDFYDQQQIDSLYAAEVERVLRDLTGADEVALFGGVRRNVARPQGRVFNAATDVHVDYSTAEARRAARGLLGLGAKAPLHYRRFMAINLWRAISDPPQDQPLAVCDAMSVVTQSGVPNTRILVNVLPPPETMSRELPPDDAERSHGWLFHFDPAHRWYYYPDMTRDELLLFKLYDSTEMGPWRCPHASFVNPAVPAGVPPRESYEIRSFLYFK